MSTECTPEQLDFHALGRREVVGRFDGGRLTSDGGGLLLREVDQRLGLLRRLAGCFSDYRNPNSVEHSVQALVAQRVYGLALGYEDLNDHDALRADSALALLAGKRDLIGDQRERVRDQGYPLAGSSTLNRLELSTPESAHSDRYKKIAAKPEAFDRLLVDMFLESYQKPPREIWLDLDATDDPLHGHQEGRFFHGYYRCYCYLPLYIFCGEHLLCARLRPSNQDGAAGSVEELERIVTQIRARWPKTRIVIRGDSGFCRDAIMSWCEGNRVRYVLGLARNKRLHRALGCEMENRIKEQQLGLFADRTSTATIRANQLRLYFASFAYVLMHGLRRLGLAGTRHAKAQCTTIRVKLLKIAARIRITVRKVWLSFSEACPYLSDLAQILANLRRIPAWAPPG